jgi:hypothetical protein
VDQRGGTVGFHEGQHGRDLLQFLRGHPLPRFDGHVGMTVTEMRNAERRWEQAVTAYQDRALAQSLAHTDCTGQTTIDEFERAAHPGRRVAIVCPAGPGHH